MSFFSPFSFLSKKIAHRTDMETKANAHVLLTIKETEEEKRHAFSVAVWIHL